METTKEIIRLGMFTKEFKGYEMVIAFGLGVVLMWMVGGLK